MGAGAPHSLRGAGLGRRPRLGGSSHAPRSPAPALIPSNITQSTRQTRKRSRFYVLLKDTLKHQDSKQYDFGVWVVEAGGWA